MDDAKVKILVVDDEVDLKQLMLQQMRREVRQGRYTFEFVYNGAEALDRLRENDQYDIVLSDINMPVMDGLTLLSQIPDVNPNVRAVMVSAYGDMENIRTAMNRGAFDFVTKPIDFSDLKVTVERTVENLMLWREALSSRDKLIAIQHELSVAEKMQRSILPKTFPVSADYDIYAHMVAASSVGGDFFDVYELDDGRVGVVIADVSDKGVPAAMFMMASRTLLKACAGTSDSPAKVLARVNQMLSRENDSMTFVTLLYGIYDPATKEFVYSNGGHNRPILVRPGRATELLEPTAGIALGVQEDFKFGENTISFEPGTLIVLYTDGVSEAERKGGEMFLMKRLCQIFRDNAFENAKQATDAVFDSVRDFVGDGRHLMISPASFCESPDSGERPNAGLPHTNCPQPD